MNQHATTAADVRALTETLTEGDIIEVGQYDNPLRVTYTGAVNGNPFVGTEFAPSTKRTSAQKSLVANDHNVGLITGAADLGTITEMRVVESAR